MHSVLSFIYHVKENTKVSIISIHRNSFVTSSLDNSTTVHCRKKWRGHSFTVVALNFLSDIEIEELKRHIPEKQKVKNLQYLMNASFLYTFFPFLDFWKENEALLSKATHQIFFLALFWFFWFANEWRMNKSYRLHPT